MELNYRIRVYIGNYAYTNSSWGWSGLTEYNVAEGTLSLEQSLVQNEIHFGACYSSKFQCTLYNISEDLSGQWVKVVRESNNVQTQIFYGLIDTCTKDFSGTYRDIVAYDFMYSIRGSNLASYWNQQWANLADNGTKTITDLVTALCAIPHVTINDLDDLPNADLEIPKSGIKEYSVLSFETFLHAVGELMGIVWQADDDYSLTAVSLALPNADSAYFDISNNIQGNNCSFEDYVTDGITAIEIYDGSNKLRTTHSIVAGNNKYPFSNNFLLLALDDDALSDALAVTADEIKGIRFTPFEINTILPDWENVYIGNKVKANIIEDYSTDERVTVKGAIYNLKLSGIQFIDANIKAPANGRSITQKATSNDDGLVVRSGDVTREDIEELEIKINSKPGMNEVEAEIDARVDANTKKITGSTGGYVFWVLDQNTGKPIELIVADDDGVDPVTGFPTAQNLWRFNANGLGHSSTGYVPTGNLDIALTADGEINASMITTGMLDALAANIFNLRADMITVGTVETSGRNLLYGTSEGSRYWQYSANDGTGEVTTYGNGVRLEIVEKATSWSYLAMRKPTQTWDRFVNSTDTFTISFDARCSANFILQTGIKDTNASHSLIDFGYTSLTGGVKKHVELTAQANGAGLSNQYFYVYTALLPKDAILEIQNLKIEAGDTATKWSVAPEDTAENSFIMLGDGITAVDEQGKANYNELNKSIGNAENNAVESAKNYTDSLKVYTEEELGKIVVSYVSIDDYNGSYANARDAAAQALIDATVNPIKAELDQVFTFSNTEGLTIKGYNDVAEPSKIDLNLRNDKFAIRYNGEDKTWMDDDEFHVEKLYGENYVDLCGLRIIKSGNHIVFS